MPPPETFHRHQTAVLWRKLGDNAQGEPILALPIELSPTDGTGVRWESGNMININPTMGALMEALKVEAVVVVDTDIVYGSQMWLGALADWYGTGSGVAGDGEVMWVVKKISVPDIKNRVSRREVWLSRFQKGRGELTS